MVVTLTPMVAEPWFPVSQTQIKGLVPETAYEAVAYSNDDLSEVQKFTTEPALALPNAGFE